jgi:hypothetical protein
MKAWIGPVLAAAQTANERREDATRDPAAPSEFGTAETIAGMHPDAAAPGAAAKSTTTSSPIHGLAGWWRRWRG